MKFWTKCEPCDGDGILSEPNEESGLEAHSHGEHTTPCDADGCDDGKVSCLACKCATCDGTGERWLMGTSYDDCPACDGEGRTAECVKCDGDGTVPCERCDGDGFTSDTCECGTALNEERTVYIGDGFIECHDCAHKRGAFACEPCKGTGEIIRTDVEVRGKRYELVGASCSRCGG